MRDIENAGNVAVTLRQGQSVVILDENGRCVAIVAPTPKHVGKMHLVVRAPKSIRVIREKDADV